MRSHIGRHDLGHFLPASSPTTYLNGVANRTVRFLRVVRQSCSWALGFVLSHSTDFKNSSTIWIVWIGPKLAFATTNQCRHLFSRCEELTRLVANSPEITSDCFHHAWRYNYLVVCLSVSDNYFYYPYVEVSMVYGINAFNCEDLQETRISMLSAYIYCPAVSDQR